jgi:hypothetical protein
MSLAVSTPLPKATERFRDEINDKYMKALGRAGAVAGDFQNNTQAQQLAR